MHYELKKETPKRVLWSLWTILVWKEAATYSPALHCSTIGASGLNFSVRNGKRWSPTAITAWSYFLSRLRRRHVSRGFIPRRPSGHPHTARIGFDYTAQARTANNFCPLSHNHPQTGAERLKVSARGKFRAISSARLWRHRLYTCALSTSSSRTTLVRSSHLAAGFALRCFQRLSLPDSDTRRCTWRHNR